MTFAAYGILFAWRQNHIVKSMWAETCSEDQRWEVNAAGSPWMTSWKSCLKAVDREVILTVRIWKAMGNDRLTIITNASRCSLSLSTVLTAAFLHCKPLDISCNEQSFVNVMANRNGNEDSISYKAQIQFKPWCVASIYTAEINMIRYVIEVNQLDG